MDATRDLEEMIMRPVKIIVEKHEDGYVAYPLGVKGIIVKGFH